MTIKTLIKETPCFVSRGEWNLAPYLEERIELIIKERIGYKARALRDLYRHMNMGCFE